MAALRTAAAVPGASPEQLKSKIEAVRVLRTKARADVERARAALLELLTPDQEATLIGLGYLE